MPSTLTSGASVAATSLGAPYPGATKSAAWPWAWSELVTPPTALFRVAQRYPLVINMGTLSVLRIRSSISAVKIRRGTSSSGGVLSMRKRVAVLLAVISVRVK